MIDRIEFCDKHNSLIKYPGKTLTFASGYNCITGGTGSGKTLLLEAIKSCKDCTVVSQVRGKIYHYSTEQHDIRQLSLVRLSRAAPHSTFEKGKALTELSHGEANSLLFGASLKVLALKSGDTLLVDEPEAGLGLTEAVMIAEAFNSLNSKNIQVIVASHHPAFVSSLMNKSDKVIVLSDYPEKDMEAYINEWEGAIEALKECFAFEEEVADDEVYEVVGAKSGNMDAATAARPKN